MIDMRPAIAPKSNQLNADDLIAGPRDIVITRVTSAESGEQMVAIYFEGDDGKPWRPCKSMSRVLVMLWGHDGAAYIGKRLRLYRDPDVKFGGDVVGGIRISHASDIVGAQTFALTTTRGRRAPYTVQPFPAAAPAQRKPPAAPRDDLDARAAAAVAALGATANAEALEKLWSRASALADACDAAGRADLTAQISAAFDSASARLEPQQQQQPDA